MSALEPLPVVTSPPKERVAYLDNARYWVMLLVVIGHSLTQYVAMDSAKAISYAPGEPYGYNARGLSYLALGDDENAFTDFNTAIRLNDNLAESWANQALVYEHRGDKERAARSYARALQLDPNYGPAKEGLARTRTS